MDSTARDRKADRRKLLLRLLYSRRALLCCLAVLLLGLFAAIFVGESRESAHSRAELRFANGEQLLARNEPAPALEEFSEAFLIQHRQNGPTHPSTLESLRRAIESGTQVNKESPQDWARCLPTFAKVGAICLTSYRADVGPGVRIHTARLLNLLSAAYFSVGNEKQGKEMSWESSRRYIEILNHPMNDAEIATYRQAMEKADKEVLPPGVPNLEQILRMTRESQDKTIVDSGLLKYEKPMTSADFMDVMPNDPTLRAFMEHGEYLRTNMNKGYARTRDGANHSRELDEKFALEHPEAARLIRQVESPRPAGLLGNMSAREWVDIELKKWNEGLISVPFGPQSKDASGPFDAIPQEVERDPDLMAEMILGLKGTMLELELRLHQARNSNNSEVRELGQRLAAVQERFDQMDSALGLSPGKEELAAYAKVKKEEEELKAELRSTPQFQFQTRAPVAEILAALPVSTTLVEYVRYGSFDTNLNRIETRYGALVLHSNSKPRWVPLASATVIDPLIDQYQDWMRRTPDDAPSDAETKSLLSRLHEAVWEPVEWAFTTRPRWTIISTDGALNFLSFATLISRRGHFVAEDFVISYVSSGRNLLIKPTATEKSNRRIEIWADPAFALTASTSGSRLQPLWDFFGWLFSWWGKPQSGVTVQSFAPLGGTRDEANAIQGIASSKKWEVKVHLGDDASEAEFRKMQPPRILHMATHGFYIATPRSTDKFGDAIMAKPSMAGRLDPLHLSGLALQGADRTLGAWNKGTTTNSLDDGLLMAAEVSRLNLSGTWLACLSACESGIGKVSDSESMRGLRTAFHVAGADNVLCSLWKVDDSYAASFMAAFYEDALKSEDDISASLGRVQARELNNVSRGSLWQRVKLAGPFTASSVGPR